MSTKKDFYIAKKVMVTGAGGFIGSHIVRALIQCGCQQIIAITRPNGDRWRLDGLNTPLTVMELDMTDSAHVADAISTTAPEVIINAAASLDRTQTFDHLEQIRAINASAVTTLITAAKKYAVQRFVQIGTIEEYGTGTVPFNESADPSPISPYSQSKAEATMQTMSSDDPNGLRTCVVRPAATYGPMQDSVMLIPVFIQACIEKRPFAMNAGEQFKDLLYIDDLVDGILAVATSDRAMGEIINLGSDQHYRIKDVVNLILDLMDHPISVQFGAHPYRPNDPMAFYLDSTKAKKLLGWTAKTPLRTGLQKTISWYIAHLTRV